MKPQRRDPLTSLKRQRLASHEHDIGAFVSALHLVLPRSLTLLPARPGREIQGRRLVRRTAHVPGAHDAVAVGHGEVEQAALIHHFVPQLRRRGVDEGVDALDGLEHRFAEDRVPEAVERALGAVRVEACFLQTVQEEGKGPFAVRTALDAYEPSLAHAQRDVSLDVSPAGDVAVVHEHEAAVAERVAVGVGKTALGGGAHVGEDEGGCGFGGEAGEVDAVPCGRDAGEDARIWSEGRWCVVADTEAVSVVRAAVVLDRGKCQDLGAHALGETLVQGDSPFEGVSRRIALGLSAEVRG